MEAMIFVGASAVDEGACVLHDLEFDPVPPNARGPQQLAELGRLTHWLREVVAFPPQAYLTRRGE